MLRSSGSATIKNELSIPFSNITGNSAYFVYGGIENELSISLGSDDDFMLIK